MALRHVFVGVGAGGLGAALALHWALPGMLSAQGTSYFELPDVRAASVERTSSVPLGRGTAVVAEVAASEAVVLRAQDDAADAPADPAHLVAGLGMVPALVPDSLNAEAGKVASSELVQPSAPSPEVLEPDLYVGALSKQTIIRARPDHDAPIVGFARTGALLRRAGVAASTKGCAEGWYKVEPDGYVCLGKAATLDPEHPILQLASVQPDRSLPLPYPYGRSRYPTPPLYTKVPNAEEQRVAERDLAHHVPKNFATKWPDAQGTPPPSLLAHGELVPRPYGYPILKREFMTGYALTDSAFAFMDVFEADGRAWGLSTDMSILPLDRLEPVRASEFFGVVLGENAQLPVTFVRSSSQYLYEGSAQLGVKPLRAIAAREAFHISGEPVKIGGVRFLATQDGYLLKEHPRQVTIQPRREMPKWAKDDRLWIEVSLLKQTLVAYRGATPIFATLVSTGKDGLGDPETTHSTPQGVFLIHTKHVTSTMSGEAADDEYDLRDVPYVQYFKDGYAFHAAFWHDAFGDPRSHGCINLSPADARHLFSITDPPVPLRWHSALSTRGTLVYVHP